MVAFRNIAAVHVRALEEQVLQCQPPMNAIPGLRALPHEKCPTVRKLLATGCVLVGDSYRRKEIHAQQLRELPCVDRVASEPGLPDQFHLTSVGYTYRVSLGLKLVIFTFFQNVRH